MVKNCLTFYFYMIVCQLLKALLDMTLLPLTEN